MSVTVLSSQPRALYPSLAWAESPLLQIPPSLGHTTTFTAFGASEETQFKKRKEKHASRGGGNMRLTRPSETRSFGLLHIVGEAQVVDLDAPAPGRGSQGGGVSGQTEHGGVATICCSRDALDAVLSDMVIVVPCKDEDLAIIRGVILAIPPPCLVILVSNCKRGEHDEYMQQAAMVRALGREGRQILAVHQKDAAAAAAFRAVGMEELCDSSGAGSASGSASSDGSTIRNGKGEGMVLGIALAAAFCPERRYIGFVDADNFCAASVTEYCKIFAAGFAMSPSPDLEDSMIRLRWCSKPKLRNGGIEFASEGRCSKIVNSWLSRLFAPGERRKETPPGSNNNNNNRFVTTGNAGEHAMTMGLALKLRLAAGYAIEPFHFVDLLERAHLSTSGNRTLGKPGTCNNIFDTCSPRLPPPSPLDKPVRVLQIRTLSPHYHRPSDNDHIRRMWAAGLGSIFHGLISHTSMPGFDHDNGNNSISDLRRDMHDFAVKQANVDSATGELPQPRTYRPLENIDLKKFRELMKPSLGKGSLRAVGFVGRELA
ncbi:hypothetical protein VTI28DRAFT_5738 [Corynascus sepedonium]